MATMAPPEIPPLSSSLSSGLPIILKGIETELKSLFALN